MDSLIPIANKASEVIDPAVRSAVSKISGPFADELGAFLASFLTPYRVGRQAKAFLSANEKLEKWGSGFNPSDLKYSGLY